MFTNITMENFDSEIWLEYRPVLLVCIHRGFETKKLIEILEAVSREIIWDVKICLLYQGAGNMFDHLSVEGTPTFMLYNDGEEIGRILGMVSPDTLIEFIAEQLGQRVSDFE